MLIIKKTFRWVIIALMLILILMVMAMAIIRFVIFPNIDHYTDDVAAKITKTIGLKTTVGHIATGWDGISPRIRIAAVDVYDTENQPALHLENVKGTFSWLSIPMLSLHLSNISISNPQLTIRRKENGSLYVAGIPMAGEGKPDFANWLLSQSQINVQNAAIIWQDDLRKAPALSLEKVDLKVNNPAWRKIFGQHLFNFTALPSTGTPHPIQVDGHFFGRDVSKAATWQGQINLGAKDVDLTAWKPWFDYPIDLHSGAGATNITLSFADKNVTEVKADIAVNDLSAKLKADSPLFNAEQLSGLLTWEKTQQKTTISAKRIKLKADNGLDLDNGSGFVSYMIKDQKPWVNTSIKLDRFNLKSLNSVQSLLKLPDHISQPLTALSPQGSLTKLTMRLQGNPEAPSHYQLQSTFKDVSIHAYKKIPGFENISGEIDANEDGGILQLASTNAFIDIKDVLRWPVPAKTLSGKISWNNDKDRLKIVANDILVASDHINGSLNASYHMNGIKGGYLDLSGQFENGDAQFAPFYYPLIMGEETIDWLDSSIISGKANDVQLTVKGSLDDFPYVDKDNQPDPSLGIFKVSARISDAVLEYGKSWPKIENLGLDMRFEGNSMMLDADKGTISGINIVQAKAVIPQLNTYGANAQVLKIDGTTEGPTANGINFINASPVKQVTLGFTDDLKTAGTGKLDISLNLPLNDIEASTFKGAYTINNGVMFANTRMGLPNITKINGQLNFDDLGINAKAIKAAILGGPATFHLKTAADQTISIRANGTATGRGIQQFASNPISEAMTGSTDWTADIAIKKPVMNLNIQSNLKGLAINLPAPLGKTSDQAIQLTAEKTQTEAAQDRFDIAYGNMASAIILRHEKNGDLIFDRGDIGINTIAKVPTNSGLALRGEFDYINADEWLALLNNSKNKDNASADIKLSSSTFSIQKMDIFNRSLNALTIIALPSNEHWRMKLTSREVDGDIEWRSPTKTEASGAIIARLSKLHIPTSNENDDDKPIDEDIEKLDQQYPDLDIQVADFKLGKKDFGSLELTAHEIEDDWVIEQLKISNPDNILLAEGRWHNWTRNPNTNLTFSLTANDVGNTLKRFGQPNVVKGGIALISGQLNWPGSPHQFKTKGLNGSFRLGASKGQVIKVKPGVGRLFGLLTLQSLPRRLTLDFRDLFSEGFAFDEISGDAKISNGIMHSDDFFMTGPAAETEIKGDIDLNKETQHLNVKVVPHISDSLSLAALAGGPVAGVAAFVAQKILKDPLNKIAQSQYVISGTWDKPIELDAKTEKKNTPPTNSPLNAQ